jgi:G6PDH family F420-dependent oxidoreductase
MVSIGYSMLCEQRSPTDLVRDAVAAERAGFDFLTISDHFHPWVEAQGHSPNAWATLGAIAQATERAELMTMVTAPIIRYHPVIVAHQAATVSLLSGGRFTLGLGAGEQLNEHVVGGGFPHVSTRHEQLGEAVEIIRELLAGGYVTYHGDHYTVADAKLFDRPERPLPVGIAMSGPKSCRLAGEMADLGIAIEPRPELVRQFSAAGGSGKPMYGQLSVCWGPDRAKGIALARELSAWSVFLWKVMAELPSPRNFERAASFVSEDAVAELIPCGPELEPIVAAVRRFVDAGFTHVCIVQIGPDQEEFCELFSERLGPALREL